MHQAPAVQWLFHNLYLEQAVSYLIFATAHSIVMRQMRRLLLNRVFTILQTKHALFPSNVRILALYNVVNQNCIAKLSSKQTMHWVYPLFLFIYM